jgi:spoIIIJ-associated protein
MSEKNPFVEFEGKSVEEAIQSAAAYFGVKRDRLKIEVLCEEEKGLFGMHGAKPAKIRAARN